MKAYKHALLGAAIAVSPDVVLLAYAWRRTYLPQSHPLVRMHRTLHNPPSIAVAALLGACIGGACWASHVYSDQLTEHPLPRWVRVT